jgi:hypothetical protein
VLIDLPAVGRMTSVLFPSVIGIAMVTRGWRFRALTGACFLLQVWLAARFFTWRTPF